MTEQAVACDEIVAYDGIGVWTRREIAARVAWLDAARAGIDTQNPSPLVDMSSTRGV